MAKMDPELKAKWVDALRGGKYEQAIGNLKALIDDDEERIGFCCLGVLGAICGVSWEQDGSCFNPVEGEKRLDSGRWGGFWIAEFADRYGLGHIDDPESWQKRLAEMNDTGKTFEEIAEFIEKNDI